LPGLVKNPHKGYFKSRSEVLDSFDTSLTVTFS